MKEFPEIKPGKKKKKKCCMEGCNNKIDTDTDLLWDKDAEGYICESCLNRIGDE